MSERFFGKRNKEQPETKTIEPATPEQVEPVNTNALQSFVAEKEQEKTERREAIEAHPFQEAGATRQNRRRVSHAAETIKKRHP